MNQLDESFEAEHHAAVPGVLHRKEWLLSA